MDGGCDWSCPICRGTQDDVAFLSPCLHQFCRGCALRWALQGRNCPVCHSRTTAILLPSVADTDYLIPDVPGPAGHEEEQGAAGAVPGAQEDEFLPEEWASFFQSHHDPIKTLRPWLRRELQGLFGDKWWLVAAAEAMVVASVCQYRLDEEALERELQSSLPENTGPFVRRLVATARARCASELRQLLKPQDCPAPSWQGDNSPTNSPTNSTTLAWWDDDEASSDDDEDEAWDDDDTEAGHSRFPSGALSQQAPVLPEEKGPQPSPSGSELGQLLKPQDSPAPSWWGDNSPTNSTTNSTTLAWWEVDVESGNDDEDEEQDDDDTEAGHSRPPSASPSAPVPAEQEEPGQQGVTGPSAPQRGRDRSPSKPQSPQKRRDPSPEDPAPSHKRPRPC